MMMCAVSMLSCLSRDGQLEECSKLPCMAVWQLSHVTVWHQVATHMIWLWQRQAMVEHGLPIPAIIAWCSHADQMPVSTEFILMKKASRTTVFPLKENLSDKEKLKLAQSLAEVKKPLLDIKFSHYGSLYYAADVLECHNPQHTLELARLIPTVLDPTTSHKSRWIKTKTQSGNWGWDVNTECVHLCTNPFSSKLVYICNQHWIVTPVWKSTKILNSDNIPNSQRL